MTPKVTTPLVCSVLLHAALLVLLVLNLSFARERRVVPPRPAIIQATLIKTESQAATVAKEQPAPKAEPTPKPEAARPAPEPKPSPPDLERQRQAEQQKLEERKRQEARELKEAEAKRAAEAKRQADEKRKAEEARKRKAEEERRRQAAAEAQRRRDEVAQQDLERAMAAEEQRLAAAREGELAAKAGDVIRSLVERSWSRPPSARTGMRATLRIRLIRTGEVIDVSVVESSGNAEFDRSAVNAVRRVGQFPLPREMSVAGFKRNFESFVLVFDPQDLRL